MPERDPTQSDAAARPTEQQPSSESPPADDPTAEDSLVGEVLEVDKETLRAELEEVRDRALRSQAELENFRKRVARQMEEERRYAEIHLIRDLLPVWDNMGRAIEAAEKAGLPDSMLEGFTMVIRHVEDVLARHQCRKIEARGQPFDPHLHEAISQQRCGDHAPGTVVQEIQSGFLLHDRVVRPSQVIVSAAPAEDGEEDKSDEDE